MLHDDMGKRKKKDWKQKKSAYDQVTDDEMRGGDEGVGSTKYNDCLNWEGGCSKGQQRKTVQTQFLR